MDSSAAAAAVVGNNTCRKRVCARVCVCVIVNILVEAFGGNAQLAKSVKYLSGQGTKMRRRCCCPYPRQRSRQDQGESEREREGERESYMNKYCVGVFAF